MKTYKLFDNTAERQYEFHINGEIPKIEYLKTDNNEIYLTHTEVPVLLEGQGIGSALVEECLKDIDKKGLRLVPLCPFVAGYIQKNPHWRKIIMKGVNV